MKSILLALALSATAQAAPVLFFSDLPSGPNTGGRLNYGAVVCVAGRNFGSTRGASTVTVGGGAVADYPLWSDTKACFSLGSSAATGNIVMTVGGAASNGLPFTIRAGAIYYAGATTDLGGSPGTASDSNAGSFDAPKATIRACKNLITSGSGAICYVRGSVPDQTGNENVNAAVVLTATGSASSPLAIIAWPGESPVVGEYSNPIQTRGFYVYLTGDFWVISGFSVRAYTTAIQHTPNPTWLRVTNNKLECPYGDGETGCLMVAVNGNNPTQSMSIKVYGNEITNTGCGSGTTSGPDNSGGLANQVRQGPCALVGPMSGTLSMSGGSTLSISGASFPYNTGALYYGVHVWVDTDLNGVYEDSVMTSATASAVTLYSNSFATTTFTGAPWKYQHHVASKKYHTTYFGTDTSGIDFSYNWLHGNTALHGYNSHSTPATTSQGNGWQTISTSTAGTPARVTLTSALALLVNGQRLDVMGNSTLPDGVYFVSLPTPGNYGVIDLYSDVALTAPVTLASSGTGGTVNRTGFGMFNLSIHDNLIHDQNGACISLAGSDPSRGAITIYNNVLRDCGTGPWTDVGGMALPGFYLLNSPDYPARNISGSGTIEAYNNTIYNMSKISPPPGSVAGVVCMNAISTPLYFRMRNNIIYQPGGVAFATCPRVDRITGFGNTWFGTSTAYPPNLTDRYTYDPQFVDIAARDLRLSSTSPAIDAGSTISGLAYDYSAVPRPQGAAYDLGAYEYVSGSTPTDPLTITTATLPDGVVGGAYSLTMAASGGSGAKTWDVTVNDAIGLSMSSAGVFSGTPIEAGTFNVTARVTDSSGSATRDYTITIAAAPLDPNAVTVTNTAAAASLRVQYGAAGLVGVQTCVIDLKQGSTIVQTQTDTGGRPSRVATFTGVAAGAYTTLVTCAPFGSGSGSSATVTAATGLTTAVPVYGFARTEIGAAKMRVEWGYTSALTGTPVTVSCSGARSASIPGVATGGWAWTRLAYLNSSDVVVAIGEPIAILVP